MKIKLPRKRKKVFKKVRTKKIAACILNEILYEETPLVAYTRFYELRVPTKRDKNNKDCFYPNGSIIIRRY